jgi:hypothetical protein
MQKLKGKLSKMMKIYNWAIWYLNKFLLINTWLIILGYLLSGSVVVVETVNVPTVDNLVTLSSKTRNV